ncbi:carbohydrate-binding module family 18 protein [Piromyces sp. E2]|nr:carbohydrate-binding module family 18 protein [Piromyces sp. E2]|eukprot:OUM57037.1 carbohydrate-binding module family 18 protein [Piromyces sp. E2]
MRLIKFLIGSLAIISSINAAPVSDKCGKKYGKCGKGKCCSKYGWCGKSIDHCYVSKGCQSEFGICTVPKSNTTKNKSNSVKSKNNTIKNLNKTNTKNNKVTKNKKSSKTNKTNNTSNKKKASNKSVTSNVKWAGFRYSSYGVEDSFNYMPSVKSWDQYIRKMKGKFGGNTKGTVILIVGEESNTKYCRFGFPKPKHVSSSLKVKFSKTDQYEKFLKKCDEQNYQVWLQVEAGDNDLVKLANIVLDRYGHHPSVKGFGIDCEWWYRNYNSEKHGKPLSDSEAKRIVKAVRKRNKNYTVFAKHWKTSYMPPTYRDGMIFVNDSQGFHGSLDRMKKEFRKWAQAFPKNPVMFQIGYRADRSIWKKNPIGVAKTIANAASPYNKNIGIIWVDFTMKDALAKINLL